MEKAVNFYELKTQLADLGYNAPEVTDQLRNIIAQEEHDQAIVHTRRDGVKFEIELARNFKGDFEVLFSEASLYVGDTLHFEYFKPDVAATDAIKQLRKQINNHNTQQIMNTENLSYLQKQQKNLGFGEEMYEDLQKNIEAKTPEFTLNTTNTYNKQDVNYTLHYKAGEQHEMYFFNKYDARVNDNQHTFYLNKGQGITAKEAFNLMEGRAVYKELENQQQEKYNAWLVLEKNPDGHKLKTYSDGWNFKPEKAIDKMDIVGIGEEGAREKLLKSLQKGNNHQVNAMKNGKEVQLFIAANPAEHRVSLTNYKGEAQRLDDYKKPEFRQEKKEDRKQTQKESPADESTKKKRGRGLKAA